MQVQLPDRDDEIDLSQLLARLWAGKLTIAAVTLAALVLGAFLVLRSTPVHEAGALLQLESKAGALALPEGMQDLLSATGGPAKSPSETEMAILRSRMVMGEVARRLDLQLSARPKPWPVLGLLPLRLGLPESWLPGLAAYQRGTEAIVLDELELPEPWLGEDLELTLTGPGAFVLRLPDGTRLDGTAGQRLARPDLGLSLRVGRIEGPAGRVFLVTRKTLPETVETLQKNFAVSETPRGSAILVLRYTDPSPRQAERILDAIAQAYLNQNVARSAAEARSSLAFIDEQLPQAEAAVLSAQAALNAYRQTQNSVDVDFETRALLERATLIDSELRALALREEELKDRYTVNHPLYQVLLQNRAVLQRQLDEVRATTAAMPETQKEIFNLSRDLEVAQQVYVQLLNRQQELRVVQASTVGSVRIIDTAYSDGRPIAPRTGLVLAVHLVAGLILGSALVLARRLLHRGIRGAQEIEKTGLPVFATVNFSPEAANHRRRRGALPIMAIEKPDDLVVEAIRSLRTSLHFGMLDADTKSLLVTSAAPGAGKSFISVNLAAVAAQAGQKVCVVDADMRKGYLRRYFGLEKNGPGLSDLLSGERPLAEVMVEGPLPGLNVIASGRFPPNPSELLMRAEFPALVKHLGARFDLVVIDSPPALAVTDPVVIGRSTGARIVVARHLETMLPEIEALRRTFETAGSRITGAILNGYRVGEGSRYGGNYHYYNYRYDYRSD